MIVTLEIQLMVIASFMEGLLTGSSLIWMYLKAKEKRKIVGS